MRACLRVRFRRRASDKFFVTLKRGDNVEKIWSYGASTVWLLFKSNCGKNLRACLRVRFRRRASDKFFVTLKRGDNVEKIWSYGASTVWLLFKSNCGKNLRACLRVRFRRRTSEKLTKKNPVDCDGKNFSVRLIYFNAKPTRLSIMYGTEIATPFIASSGYGRALPSWS